MDGGQAVEPYWSLAWWSSLLTIHSIRLRAEVSSDVSQHCARCSARGYSYSSHCVVAFCTKPIGTLIAKCEKRENDPLQGTASQQLQRNGTS